MLAIELKKQMTGLEFYSTIRFIMNNDEHLHTINEAADYLKYITGRTI